MNEKTIVRPAPIPFKEFKDRARNSDGFGKGRRIIYYSSELGKFPHDFMLPMVGNKESCLKVAYRLLFGENLNSYEQELIHEYLRQGEFKVQISYNFRISLDVKLEVKWENGQIVEQDLQIIED